ncbi:MAG: hypothetical protein C0613_05765 [Desulfobulbaceae bacterium]|nr:MAG: hypothetical protein C0613_05765 [Desulfobulbaceae bacterium]
MADKVMRVQMAEEFKICPTCGYEDGFHSMFVRREDCLQWHFICPSCHGIFDIGLTVSPPDRSNDH